MANILKSNVITIKRTYTCTMKMFEIIKTRETLY